MRRLYDEVLKFSDVGRSLVMNTMCMSLVMEIVPLKLTEEAR